MTTSKISMYDGTKLYYQQVRHLQKWSWKDYTIMTKRLFETMCNRFFKIEDICKTSNQSNDENSNLQSPE